MKCPYCQADKSKCMDSRPTAAGRVRRRRFCEKCAARFTTMEVYVLEVRDEAALELAAKKLASALKRMREATNEVEALMPTIPMED